MRKIVQGGCRVWGEGYMEDGVGSEILVNDCRSATYARGVLSKVCQKYVKTVV